MPVRYYKRVVDKSKTDSPSSHYSPKQKLEAVTSYLMLGKVTLVAAALQIPEDTIRNWKRTDWWKEMEKEVRSSNNVEVSGKLRGIISRTINVIEDRLENGDYQYNPKTGAFTRRPVGAKVAGEIMSKAIDKQILIDKIEREPMADAAKIEDRLKTIQDKLLEFSRFSKSKLIEGEVTNVETPVGSDQGVGQAASGETHGEGGFEAIKN